MKLWSKESLMVGGIYSALSTPFLILDTPVTEQIELFLFSMFIICMFLLYWPKFSSLISKQTDNFPKLSYYLISVGWLPYFFIIGIVTVFICAGVFSWSDTVFDRTTNIFNLICLWGEPVSLIIAYIRTKIKIK